MKELVLEIDEKKALYIYDYKTESNFMEIDKNEVDFEIVFVEKAIGKNVEDSILNTPIQDTYIFDTFVITNDDYLMRIKGVRNGEYYGVTDCFSVYKLKPDSLLRQATFYLLNFCSKKRNGYVYSEESTYHIETDYYYAYWLLRNLLESQDDNMAIFENISTFVDVKPEITARIKSMSLDSWRVKNLEEYSYFNKGFDTKMSVVECDSEARTFNFVYDNLIKVKRDYNLNNSKSEKAKDNASRVLRILRNKNLLSKEFINDYMAQYFLTSTSILSVIHDFILDIEDMQQGKACLDVNDLFNWVFSSAYTLVDNDIILFLLHDYIKSDCFRELKESYIPILKNIIIKLYPERANNVFIGKGDVSEYFEMIYNVKGCVE